MIVLVCLSCIQGERQNRRCLRSYSNELAALSMVVPSQESAFSLLSGVSPPTYQKVREVGVHDVISLKGLLHEKNL